MSLRDGYNSDIITSQQNKLKKKKKKRFRRGSKQHIKGINKPSVSRLARTGGIKRISGQIHDDSVSVLQSYLSELTEKNNTLQEQLKQQHITIETLSANSTDNEIQVRVLTAENEEYQQTIKQTNDKYEEALNELTETRDHLNHATQQIEQYEETIQLLNNEIIHKTNKYNVQIKDKNSEDCKLKFEQLQKIYDELSIEYSKYTNDYQQLMDKHNKCEQNNKILKDKLTEMTYNNVQLEKQMNDFSIEIAAQKLTITGLQNKGRSTHSTPNHSPAKFKKQFYSPLKHADKYTALSDGNEFKELEQNEHYDNNLFSVYETYDDNEQYWNIMTPQQNKQGIDDTKSEISIDEEARKYFKRDRTRSFVDEKMRMELRHVKKSSFCIIQ